MKLTPTVEAIRRVLCPVNYSPSSQTALELAAALAAGTGAELIVAHIDETPLGKSAQDSLQHLCDWIPASVRAHCAVKEVVKQGGAAEQIVEEAVKSHADLLVIGAQPRSLLGNFILGSTTDLVIRIAQRAFIRSGCRLRFAWLLHLRANLSALLKRSQTEGHRV
jgi:nucleotide-binding universal stress UspA family protein